MFKPEPDRDALVARLTSLERRQRLLQPLAGAGALLVAAALAAFAAGDPDIVQARRVELIDLKGETRATLAADTAGVNLTLFDKRGRITAAIRLNGDPRLTVLDQAGREVAGIGAPRVQHLVEQGRPRHSRLKQLSAHAAAREHSLGDPYSSSTHMKGGPQ